MSRFIDISLSRDCCAAMRGLAIVAIVLHNYCHLLPGTLDENEFEYFQRNADGFIRALTASGHLLIDVLSFAGWYGVPVFMFLTGYGLVRKYETGGAPFGRVMFLRESFRKLFCLLLPGTVLVVATLAAVIVSYGNIPGVRLFASQLFQLTMLPDLVYPFAPPSPGVYWYFGLTMQFYVIYAFLIYRRPAWWMAVAVTVSLVCQELLAGEPDGLAWFRHNSTGWVMVLAIGVMYGRTASVPLTIAAVVPPLSAIVFVPSMLDGSTWQISLAAAVLLAVTAGRLTMLIPVWRDVWIWFGRMSPFLFAAHPVVRLWFFQAMPGQQPSLAVLAVYFAACIVAALGYRRLWVFTRAGVARLVPAQ